VQLHKIINVQFSEVGVALECIRLSDNAINILKTKGVEAFQEAFGDSFVLSYATGVTGSVSATISDVKKSEKFDVAGNLKLNFNV